MTARKIQKWRNREHLGFESLSAEKILRCSYFWNLYQSQVDSFYSFYVDMEESLERRYHTLCKIAGCVAAQLRESTGHTHRHHSSYDDYSHSSSSDNNNSAHHHDRTDGTSSSPTSLMQLREEAIFLRQFVDVTNDEIVKLLRAFDETHGSGVFDNELADLRETHYFLNGIRLTGLISRIDEDIAKWKSVNVKANGRRMSIMTRNGNRAKTIRKNSTVLLQSIVGTALDVDEDGHDGEILEHQTSQPQEMPPMASMNTADRRTRNKDQMERECRGVRRIFPSKFMRFLNGR
eukprot:CAMPEP_0197233922 /NCGR_PEP_ID=MMETSP1429-20130617/1834_1 /TAXON_ID=49237 /ORGANISM="Chaetoceros  sp., Strain UNC1202" /LENGTH=290 /DNA_ID=CAMNT_0042692239 /DNA_START=148 /DNA_END=1020 /DNA_ORIENTATION=+